MMEGQVEKERSSVVTGATRREGGTSLHEPVHAMQYCAVGSETLSACFAAYSAKGQTVEL
jgi:hypothetical protein